VVVLVVVLGVVVLGVLGVLEDAAGKRGTKETEKVCPLIVVVLITGVPVVTVSVPSPSNSE